MLHQHIAASVAPLGLPAADREELILQHLSQVRLIARQVGGRLPISVSIEDLESAGTLGLIAAVDHFDPNQRVKLRTYAEYKIRGAILDSLRTMDWAPRVQRRRSRQIEAVIDKLTQRLNRAPSQEEIAAELGLTISSYQEWLSAARNLTVGSLEALPGNEEGQQLLRYIAELNDRSPSQIVEQSELEHLLAVTIEALPELEKTVLQLYYFEDLTQKEIGRIVNLHESRVSQIKTQAILRLRSVLKR